MKHRLMVVLVPVLLHAVFPNLLAGQENPQTTILSQPDAPISIDKYDAEYRERGDYTREGIHHELEYTNTSNRRIRAIEFGLLSFNVFNEFLDRAGGIDMDSLEPGDDADASFRARAYSDFSFFTGIAYVSAVRFMNGEIWKADLDAIASKVREIQEDFDADNLKEQEDQDAGPGSP